MIDGVVGLSDIETEELKQELVKRGYEVHRVGECRTCGNVVDGPHFCPGRGVTELGGTTYGHRKA